MKPWFNRWRKYPASILMHIFGWGAPIGVLLAHPDGVPLGMLMAFGFAIYQVASGVRHALNDGRMDTAGLDFTDAVIGAVPAYIITKILLAQGVL